MTSKSSFCNATLIMDGCNRTLWVGVAYLFIALLGLMPMILDGNYYGGVTNGYETSIEPDLLCTQSVAFGLMAMLFSVVSVAFAFGFMYNKASAEFYGSIPVSRRSLFFSQFLVAFIPLLVADLIILGVVLMACLASGVRIEVIAEWFFMVVSMDFICVSICTFCAQLAGNKPVYVILFLMAMGCAWIVELAFYEVQDLFLYGVTLANSEIGEFSWLSPIIFLVYTANNVFTSGFYPFVMNVYLAAYLFSCTLLVIASMILFQRRKIESAGDGIAVPRFRPLFSFVFSMAAGLGFTLLIFTMFGILGNGSGVGSTFIQLLFVLTMVFGTLVAYVILEISMAKNKGILRQRKRGIIALAVVMTLISGCMATDALGISKNVPNPDDVQSVAISGFVADTAEADVIADAIELHQAILDASKNGYPLNSADGAEPESVGIMGSTAEEVSTDTYWTNLFFAYKMKDGTYRRYSYDIPVDGQMNAEAKAIADKFKSFANSTKVKELKISTIRNTVKEYGANHPFLVSKTYDDGGYETIYELDKKQALDIIDKAIAEDLMNDGFAGSLMDGWCGDESLGLLEFSYKPNSWEYIRADGTFLTDKGLELCKKHTPNTIAWLEKNCNLKLG